MAHLLVDALTEKKGSDILVLDIHNQAVFADYFVICTGDSEPQIKALIESAVSTSKLLAERAPRGAEGDAGGGWVLVDYGDVIMHVFSPRQRRYYDLESLWHEARVVLRLQ